MGLGAERRRGPAYRDHFAQRRHANGRGGAGELNELRVREDSDAQAQAHLSERSREREPVGV